MEQAQREALSAAAGEHLAKRRGSVFRRLGEARCRELTAGLVDALFADLAASSYSALRERVQTNNRALLEEGVTFSDLRFMCESLRSLAREHSAGDPEVDRVSLEAWFAELIKVCCIDFVVWRDEQEQKQGAKAAIERALAAALAEKDELVQRARETSTPIAPVFEGILVVPLVGSFDPDRAQFLTEKLLGELSRTQTRVTLIDITGVPVFDAETAELMLRLARSVKLLGAHVILVGMSPDNARMIVSQGIELGELRTLGTLRDGLTQALRLQGFKIVSA